MARAKKKKNALEAFIKSIEKQRERSRKRLEELSEQNIRYLKLRDEELKNLREASEREKELLNQQLQTEKLRADINREVKAETDKGRTLEEATKHAISQCIEKLGMYLSADIYMDDDDYEWK